MVKVRKQTAVEWAMKGGSIMKTGRNIAVLVVSLLAVLVLVLLWIGRGGREPEKTDVSVICVPCAGFSALMTMPLPM